MLGIRVTTAGAGARELFTEPEGDWLWQAAERAGLPAMVSVPGLLPEIGRLAERHPGMRFVIDHLALVRDAKDEAAFGDLADLLAVARHPNVAAKASALPRYSSEAYPYPPPAPLFAAGVRRVRPEPVFLGHRHDRHPLHLPPGGDAVHRGTAVADGRRSSTSVMGRALCDWLGWKLKNSRHSRASGNPELREFERLHLDPRFRGGDEKINSPC